LTRIFFVSAFDLFNTDATSFSGAALSSPCINAGMADVSQTHAPYLSLNVLTIVATKRTRLSTRAKSTASTPKPVLVSDSSPDGRYLFSLAPFHRCALRRSPQLRVRRLGYLDSRALQIQLLCLRLDASTCNRSPIRVANCHRSVSGISQLVMSRVGSLDLCSCS
jgi:hypothetical protein